MCTELDGLIEKKVFMVKKRIMETFLNNLCSQGIKGEFLNSQSAIAEFSFQWSCHFEQQSGNLNSLNLKQASYLSDGFGQIELVGEVPNPPFIFGKDPIPSF